MIGRKGGNEKALSETVAKRERAEAEAETATVRLGVVQADTDDALRRVALSDVDAAGFERAKVEAVGKLQAAQADAERTRIVLSALSEEADRLAVIVAQERLAAREAEVVTLTQAHGEADERLRDLTTKLDAAEVEAEKARRAVGRAARFSPEAAEAARVAAAQDAEQVAWHAQHSMGHPDRWPIHLHAEIEAAIQERRQEWHAEKAKRRAASEANLAAHGLTVEDARQVLGVGESRAWPRREVR